MKTISECRRELWERYNNQTGTYRDLSGIAADMLSEASEDIARLQQRLIATPASILAAEDGGGAVAWLSFCKTLMSAMADIAGLPAVDDSARKETLDREAVMQRVMRIRRAFDDYSQYQAPRSQAVVREVSDRCVCCQGTGRYLSDAPDCSQCGGTGIDQGDSHGR